jgi:hypothetical protein
MALSPKQERFCQCIVSGMSGKDSYIEAYQSTGSAQNAYNEASKLLMRDDIQERLAVLRKPLEAIATTRALSAREEQIAFIRERIAICQAKEDEQSIIRYTDMLNKINALYKETETPEAPENKVTQLDTNALKKLTGIA